MKHRKFPCGGSHEYIQSVDDEPDLVLGTRARRLVGRQKGVVGDTDIAVVSDRAEVICCGVSRCWAFDRSRVVGRDHSWSVLGDDSTGVFFDRCYARLVHQSACHSFDETKILLMDDSECWAHGRSSVSVDGIGATCSASEKASVTLERGVCRCRDDALVEVHGPSFVRAGGSAKVDIISVGVMVIVSPSSRASVAVSPVVDWDYVLHVFSGGVKVSQFSTRCDESERLLVDAGYRTGRHGGTCSLVLCPPFVPVHPVYADWDTELMTRHASSIIDELSEHSDPEFCETHFGYLNEHQLAEWCRKKVGIDD
jgi:hypothetical protein